MPSPNQPTALCILLILCCLGCGDKSQPTQDGKKALAPNGGQTDRKSESSEKRASSFRSLKLLEGEKFDEAWKECQNVLLSNPNDTRALYVASQILHRRSRLEQALQMVDRIPANDPEYGLNAHRGAVLWCLNGAALSEAEQRASRLLELYPKDPELLKSMAAILDLQGRRYESSLWMQRLVAIGNLDITTLVLAVDTAKPVQSEEIILRKLERTPEDIRLKSSLAFGALFEKDPERAERIFREIIASPNAAAACYAGLGLSLIEQEKYGELPNWLASVPRPAADAIPMFWRVLGLWYQHDEAYEEAIYCFTRSVELDPFDFLASAPLAQSLLASGQQENAALAEALFQQMQLANRNINYSRDGFRRPEWLLQIADALEQHGRGIESLAWRELNEAANDKSPTVLANLQNQRKQRIAAFSSPQPKSNLPWTSDSLSPPDLKRLASRSPATPQANAPSIASSSGQVSFKLDWIDVATQLGVDFQFQNGDDKNAVGMQTYQSNGGGAGSIDYDRDGWPDLYAVQGGGDPRYPNTNLPSALFRNERGERMFNVASYARVTNMAYGQGVAVGDWDQDGYPDMLVLNFGQNRLFRNMGDGTFEQVDVPAMSRQIETAPVWSVSGAIADVDGDQLPDLIEVNYSSGSDVITHQCLSQDKLPQVCRPTEFPASKDFIYLSDGQGGFRLGNDQWNMELDEGRGLGIIVGNLDNQFGNDIYIANDMSANNLLISHPDPKKQGRFALGDEAVRRGCAVDIQGKPQASMGVGCADVDRNGTLDLFMTNFIDEYNALYTQTPSHFYQDASRRYRLIDPKKKTLGFGAQLIDLDRDGWQDIFVVNGHVDDYRSKGQPFQMRPQVFLQRENAFAEQSNDNLGGFFQKEYLSRSLGLWDFNRDGQFDAYITHLDHPISILKNQTTSDGSWISIEPIGTQSERDAIGAQLEIRVGEQRWVHQRLAGNGFECSNDPAIYLGLGRVESIDELIVTWPSGSISQFENISPNKKYRIVESINQLTEDSLESKQD
jgi:tetratricopeptide (TPR) repeat protein